MEEKIKQEEEGVYEEREVINGMLVSVRWIKPHQCYEVLVGQEEKRPEGMKAEEYFEKLIKGTPDYTENAGDTREQAKKVFLLVKQLVEKGKSLEEIHEMRGSDESES